MNRLGFAGRFQTQKAHAVAATHLRPHGGPSWAPGARRPGRPGRTRLRSSCESAAFRRLRNMGTAPAFALTLSLLSRCLRHLRCGDGGAASFGGGRRLELASGGASSVSAIPGGVDGEAARMASLALPERTMCCRRLALWCRFHICVKFAMQPSPSGIAPPESGPLDVSWNVASFLGQQVFVACRD